MEQVFRLSKIALGSNTRIEQFAKLKRGEYERKINHSGRPQKLESDYEHTLLKNAVYKLTLELTENVGVDHSTFVRHSQSMGKIVKVVKGFHMNFQI